MASQAGALVAVDQRVIAGDGVQQRRSLLMQRRITTRSRTRPLEPLHGGKQVEQRTRTAAVSPSVSDHSSDANSARSTSPAVNRAASLRSACRRAQVVIGQLDPQFLKSLLECVTDVPGIRMTRQKVFRTHLIRLIQPRCLQQERISAEPQEPSALMPRPMDRACPRPPADLSQQRLLAGAGEVVDNTGGEQLLQAVEASVTHKGACARGRLMSCRESPCLPVGHLVWASQTASGPAGNCSCSVVSCTASHTVSATSLSLVNTTWSVKAPMASLANSA